VVFLTLAGRAGVMPASPVLLRMARGSGAPGPGGSIFPAEGRRTLILALTSPLSTEQAACSRSSSISQMRTRGPERSRKEPGVTQQGRRCFQVSLLPRSLGCLDRFAWPAWFPGFGWRVPGLSVWLRLQAGGPQSQLGEKAPGLFVWIQIRAFSSFLSLCFHPQINHVCFWSVHTSAGVHADRGTAEDDGLFRSLEPAGLQLPFQGKDVTQIFPRPGQVSLVHQPWGRWWGNIQARSVPRAQPLRNSLIRVLFTALWQTLVLHWLKPDQGLPANCCDV
jgi:hypothetical protein